MRLVLLALSLLGFLAGCETRYPNGPPLREVRTEEERQFVHCIGRDPLLVTPQCYGFRRDGH